ncbi:MAG: hypothetical protein AB7S38_14965 [Vulcanimicrobiota bacterium]
MHSQLEHYLRRLEGQGRLESAGQFSLDQKRALEKLASFQLPRPGDWALKLIQAAVAGGAAEAIAVRLGRKQAEFSFAAPAAWTLERLRTDLLDPNPEPERAFAHLKAAFWNVGIHFQRPVELALPGQSQALVWLGDGFETVELEQPPPRMRLTIAHQRLGEKLGFWASLKLWRQANSVVHSSLSARAFTCPLPLIVDGRRLDALHFAPMHGFGPSSQPLVIGRLDEGEPRWRLPPGTLENLRYRQAWLLSSHLRELSQDSNQIRDSEPQTWVAYLLSLHLHYVTQGKSRYLRHLRLPSQCHWIADGVASHIENFPIDPRAVTVALFASADGLPTDLTTLRLIDGPERSQRYGRAVRALARQLDLQNDPDFDDLLTSHTRGDIASAVLFAGMGLLTVVALPASLLFWWAAHQAYKTAGQEPRQVVEGAMGDLKALRTDWAAMVKPFEDETSTTQK